LAIDTAEKRKAVAAIPGIPFAVSVTPNATPDQEWRQEAGWGYPGILAGEAEAPPSGGSSFQVREEQTEPRWTKSWRLMDNWRNWVLLRE